MSVLDRGLDWAGANLVPLVLIPLAAGLIWVAVWRVWLPPAGNAGAVARTVTSVDSNAPTRPTHKVTRVVRTTQGAVPSRRSEALALALVLLGAGTAIVGVFHDRIGSIEVDKDGLKIELTAAERSGAARLVARLAAGGASTRSYARALERYLRAVATSRPVLGSAAPAALAAEQAEALADRIADEHV
jgi:hypothetical protein